MARHLLISFLVIALITIACSKSIMRDTEERLVLKLSDSVDSDSMFESEEELLIGSDVKMSSDDNAWAGRR